MRRQLLACSPPRSPRSSPLQSANVALVTFSFQMRPRRKYVDSPDGTNGMIVRCASVYQRVPYPLPEEDAPKREEAARKAMIGIADCGGKYRQVLQPVPKRNPSRLTTPGSVSSSVPSRYIEPSLNLLNHQLAAHC